MDNVKESILLIMFNIEDVKPSNLITVAIINVLNAQQDTFSMKMEFVCQLTLIVKLGMIKDYVKPATEVLL